MYEHYVLCRNYVQDTSTMYRSLCTDTTLGDYVQETIYSSVSDSTVVGHAGTHSSIVLFLAY